MQFRTVCTFLTPLMILTQIAQAAPLQTEDPFQFFQEEAKVAIASQREQTLQEAPSIVSVITRHDIEAYGDRDLADVLRRVPGFEFAMDIYSEASLTFRGISVEEGKSLLMINGIMQNELGFGTYNFFGSIPAAMIERVEIIRGPGSAIYGGFAEADVINVVTFQPDNLNGMRVSGDVGAVGHNGVSRSGNVSYAAKTTAIQISADVGYGTTLLSTRDYTDFFGNRLHQNADTSYRNWQHVITEASAKNLTLRYQRTSFTYGGQDTSEAIQPALNGNYVEQINNYNDVTHLDYKAVLSDRLTLQPLFEYTRNNTLSFANPAAIDANFQGSGTTLYRYRGEIAAIYKAPWSAEIRLGGGYIRDEVHSIDGDGTPGLQLTGNGADLASHTYTASNFGLFQYVQQMDPFGLTLGGRYEDTSFGNAFAPRAGLTYIHDAFNAKLLYGRAFRIPTPWQAFSRNFGFSGDLKPETADTTELELGYKFTPHVKGTVNAFFIDINQPIVFQGNNFTYANFGRIQSEGAETELRADYAGYGGFANVSYARPGPNTSEGFVTRSKKQFLATPPIKVDLGTYYRIGIYEFSPSATYLAHRAGQSSLSANDLSDPLEETTDYHPLLLANMNIVARNVIKDFDIHLGIHNIFDTRYMLIQPYFGDHAPMPAQDREIDFGFTWHI